MYKKTHNQNSHMSVIAFTPPPTPIHTHARAQKKKEKEKYLSYVFNNEYISTQEQYARVSIYYSDKITTIQVLLSLSL